MLHKHRPTPQVNLHLPLNLKAGPFKPEIEAPDAGE